MTTRRGLFVTFEGGEGSGKTTQAELLSLRLRAGGWNVVHAREPGGTRLGEEIRRLLLHPEEPLGVETELLLFLTARAQLVRSVIVPALDEGGAVICDRFSDSTFAYQGYGRGLDLETIRRLNDFATGGLVPDLTVLLDVPSDAGRARKGNEDDAFQREDDSFHDRVNAGYLALARAEPQRWLVLDGTLPPHELAQTIAARVDSLRPGLQ